MRLWNRKALIVVDTVANIGGHTFTGDKDIIPALSVPCGKDGFDCRFDIHKDLTPNPNRAKIEIFNLTLEHRDALSARKAKGPVRVRLDAGYEKGISRIFEGDCRLLYHDRDQGADIVTTIESGDGEAAVQGQRLSKSWAPGTTLEQVIKDATAALGMGSGNISTIAGALLTGWGSSFTQGTAMSGAVVPELNNICRSAGVEWSIQDGVVQFLKVAKALDTTAVLVTSDTGMEGAPKMTTSHGKNKASKTMMAVSVRLIPDIWPGRKVQLEDKSIWRVDKATYRGETRGGAWGIHLECSSVQ